MSRDGSGRDQGTVLYAAVARFDPNATVVLTSYVPSRRGSDYRASVSEVTAAPGFESKIQDGNRYRLVGSKSAFNFVPGNAQRGNSTGHRLLFILVTNVEYPERVAFDCIGKIRKAFTEASLRDIETASEGQVRDPSTHHFSSVTLPIPGLTIPHLFF